jgi:transposase
MSARKRRQTGRERWDIQQRDKTFSEPSRHDLERENERLKKRIEDLEREITKRDQRIDKAEKQIEDAEKQIADLERQLAVRRQNSTNSSRPPSSDGLAGEPRKRGRRKKSRRKPGGQEGHPGAHRPLAPPEKVAEFHDVLPAQCGNCHRPLPQQLEQVQTVGEVQRHQVTELPPIEAKVIEYRCHRVRCPDCGESTRAAVPPEARPQSGSQLTALIAYLTVVCRMPRRVAQTLLEQVLKTPISLGSTQKSWEEASEAVATPCEELEGQLKDEPVLNVDETGWRTNGDKRYLWAFVAAGFVVYTLAKTRGSALLIRVLGAVFSGILCSDRGSAYLKYHKGTAQFCWAHLKRNILGILDLAKTSATERFCRDALALHARLFRLWHKFRGGQIDRSQLVLRSIPLQKRFFALAERHLDSPDRQVQNLATAMFDHCQRLFAFLEFENVDPTNNSAERALRTGVQWRKVCFGTRSDEGERATTRLLTVTETCDKQQRNSLLYLTEAITCHRRHQPAPSLLKRPM